MELRQFTELHFYVVDANFPVYLFTVKEPVEASMRRKVLSSVSVA